MCTHFDIYRAQMVPTVRRNTGMREGRAPHSTADVRWQEHAPSHICAGSMAWCADMHRLLRSAAATQHAFTAWWVHELGTFAQDTHFKQCDASTGHALRFVRHLCFHSWWENPHNLNAHDVLHRAKTTQSLSRVTLSAFKRNATRLAHHPVSNSTWCCVTFNDCTFTHWE